MKRAFIWFTLLIFLICSTAAYAGSGRTGAQILDMSGGTRASGMGDTFVAVSGAYGRTVACPSGEPLSSVQEYRDDPHHKRVLPSASSRVGHW